MGSTWSEALPDAFISQLKNGVFGVVQNNLRLIFLFQRLVCDLARSFDQAAQQRFAAHDLA